MPAPMAAAVALRLGAGLSLVYPSYFPGPPQSLAWRLFADQLQRRGRSSLSISPGRLRLEPRSGPCRRRPKSIPRRRCPHRCHRHYELHPHATARYRLKPVFPQDERLLVGRGNAGTERYAQCGLPAMGMLGISRMTSHSSEGTRLNPRWVTASH